MRIGDTSWSPEDRLMFQCVRGVLLRKSDEPVPDEAGLDWDRLVDRVVDGGVAPLVYERLRSDDRVPPSILERLRSLYFRSGAENIRYLAHAGKLFDGCNRAGIDVIALRGIAFVESLFPDIALRPVSDIDILVRPADQDAVASVLDRLGYWSISGHPHQWTNASVVIDMHTDLVGADRIASRSRAVRIDMDAVWESAVTTTIAGVQTRTLSWVDTLLSCSLHSLKHSCDRLIWFADMAVLLASRGSVPWETLVARTRRFRLTKPVYYALNYLMGTLKTEIPQDVIEAFHPTQVGWMEQRCMKRILNGEQVGRFGEIFTLFMMDHTRDRLAFVYETCFPNRDVIAQAYGENREDALLSFLRRLWHVAEAALNVVRRGLLGSRLPHRSTKIGV